jgi:hypothetical protein
MKCPQKPRYKLQIGDVVKLTSDHTVGIVLPEFYMNPQTPFSDIPIKYYLQVGYTYPEKEEVFENRKKEIRDELEKTITDYMSDVGLNTNTFIPAIEGFLNTIFHKTPKKRFNPVYIHEGLYVVTGYKTLGSHEKNTGEVHMKKLAGGLYDPDGLEVTLRQYSTINPVYRFLEDQIVKRMKQIFIDEED